MRKHKTKWIVQFSTGGRLYFSCREDAVACALDSIGAWVVAPLFV